MAKRRSEIGKKGKHARGSVVITEEKIITKRKKKLWKVVVAVAVIAVILIIASYFLIFTSEQDEDEDKEVLITDTPSNAGYPDEKISYDLTIYNPSDEPDIFSPLVSDLPSDWTISIPETVSVESKEIKNEKFSITPSPRTAINKTYSFTVTVTSGNTQRSYALEYELTVFHASYGIDLMCYNNSHDADPGRSTYYGIVCSNSGNGEDSVSFSYNISQLPHNWTVTFKFEASEDPSKDTLDVPGFSSEVVICNVTTFSNSSKGRYDIEIYAKSENGNITKIWLNTSLIKDFEDETVQLGDKIQVNYIGTFTNGVIFDTSHYDVAINNDYPKTPDFSVRSQYDPLKMYVGPTDSDQSDAYTKVIDGFWEGVLGLKVGETTVVRFSPEKGYNDGLWRIFEITVVSIDD
ncbi:MAG: FKBP-type peptidyl-prolyl cis-trans isomerase [Methanomassiliicoccales archaeon]|nr:MAG: FKBP-type peptidyl-prolyl cis-trans isomerase [Methanomassiliicoccales archaeon]